MLRGTEVRRLSGAVSEVASPAVFVDLNQLIAQAQPQVAIASPKADQVIKTNQVEVQLKLSDLSIYKDEVLALGPHIQVFLDNQPAQSVYSLDETLIFTDLAPGSHTLRAIAVRPWGESFKNDGAYAQLNFHVLAKTGENTPATDRPLLTYLEPQGTYGAEPVLLDFYLNNAPLHSIAQDLIDQNLVDQNLVDQNSKTQNSSQADRLAGSRIADWRIRAVVNGQSFVLDQWQPLYLKGLTPGQNWVQITLVDTEENLIENTFNSTVRTFTYDPDQQDTLAKIVRGELSLEQVGQIVTPDYAPPAEPPVEPPVAIPADPPAEPIETLEPADQDLEEQEDPEAKTFETEMSGAKALEAKTPEERTPEITTPETEKSEAEKSEAGKSGLTQYETELEKTTQENMGSDDERSQSANTTIDSLKTLETTPFESETPTVERPSVQVPSVQVPSVQVPSVQVPELERPEVKRPDVELPDS
ncbi:MAG: hypothetical protein WA883_17695 [Phormidesmis sp.]